MYVVICGIILVDALFGEWFQWLRVDRRPICVKKKKKLFKKHLYYCGWRTGVAPAWVSIHAFLPCRPILIQCCANTFTVQGGLYEILTVTIQIKTNDWYIPDCDAPLFYIWAVQGQLLHVTFESVVMKCKKWTMKMVNSNCAHLLL